MEDSHRKRLMYRAHYRGFKEADIVIGGFAKAHIPTMTEVELSEFEQLLEVPDWDLFAWVIGQKPTPRNYEGPVLNKMKAFPVAEQLRASLEK